LAASSLINEELFIEPVARLSQIIDLNRLDREWSEIVGAQQWEVLRSLKYVEDIIGQNLNNQENEISADEIHAILQEINELYKAIFASLLPSDLKSTLLDLLHQMLRDVHEYRIRGAAALRDLLTRSIGVVAANKEAIEANKDTPEIQSFARTLARIDAAYAFAMKMQPLLQAAANIFPALAAHIK
jgi:hypothetical protein